MDGWEVEVTATCSQDNRLSRDGAPQFLASHQIHQGLPLPAPAGRYEVHLALMFIPSSHAEQRSLASDILFARKWFVKFSLDSVVYFCPSVQFPSTSVRLQMEDAATCVCCLLVGNTDVRVPLIFTWLLTIRPACPTVRPVRSAAFLSRSTSKF